MHLSQVLISKSEWRDGLMDKVLSVPCTHGVCFARGKYGWCLFVAFTARRLTVQNVKLFTSRHFQKRKENVPCFLFVAENVHVCSR